MKYQEFLRLVEEICFILKFNQPATHQVIEFYKKFSQSQTHEFRSQIIIGACVFLVSKIQENQNKIRDIVNVCYVVTSLYKVANKKKQIQGIQYLNLEFIIEDFKNTNLLQEIIPNFSLDKYNEFKKNILEAQQHLLRVLNYDLDTSKLTNYKLLLNYMHQFKLPTAVMNLMIKIYNDSIFAQVKQSPKCCLHFSLQIALKAKLIELNEIDPRLLQKNWWEVSMQIKYETLLDYGIEMMKYYENIE